MLTNSDAFFSHQKTNLGEWIIAMWSKTTISSSGQARPEQP
jgi:hypothetical protein